MHSQTTPRALVLTVTMLLLAAFATPACSLLQKSDSTAPPAGGGAKATPASNTTETSPTVEPVVVQVLDTQGLKTLGAQDATIVDIRAKEDFDLERLPDAKNHPMAKFTETAAKWPKDEAVVVYGSGDAEAKTASSWLVRNGFERVYRLEGGIEAYDGTREGPLGKYRLEKPTVVYIYIDDSPLFPDSAKVTPKIEELKKEWGKKVDFEMISPATFDPTLPAAGIESLIDNDEAHLTTLPTVFMIDSDPRTYRKATGVNSLRVLYSWLQEL